VNQANVPEGQDKAAKPGIFKRSGLIIILVLTLLVTIIVLQNTESVQTRILFIKITMPRALLLFITLLFGFIAGIIVSIGVVRRQKKKQT
jgi:uncharacterized integral membrane protein